ncbi:hypothetical protein GINT2_001812 [Glugoides intestinalis]
MQFIVIKSLFQLIIFTKLIRSSDHPLKKYTLISVKEALLKDNNAEIILFSNDLSVANNTINIETMNIKFKKSDAEAKITSQENKKAALTPVLEYRSALKKEFQLFRSQALSYALKIKQYNIILKNIAAAMLPNKFKDNMILARELLALQSKIQEKMDNIKVLKDDIQVVESLVDLYEAGIHIKSLEIVPGITQKILNLELANETALNMLKGITSEILMVKKDLDISEKKQKEVEAEGDMLRIENSYLLDAYNSIREGGSEAVIKKFEEDINEHQKSLEIKRNMQIEVKTLKEAKNLYADVNKEVDEYRKKIESVEEFIKLSTEKLDMKNEILAKEMKMIVEKGEKIKEMKNEIERFYKEHEKDILEPLKKKARMEQENLKLFESTRLLTKEMKEEKIKILYDVLIVLAFTLISGGVFSYVICKELYLQGKKLFREDK